MKDIKELTEKITLPKRKYACMYCKGNLLNKNENIDKILVWIEENNLTKSEGDILLHFLAGPGFIKAPEEDYVSYKSSNKQIERGEKERKKEWFYIEYIHFF